MQGFPRETDEPIERVISLEINDTDGPDGLISRTRAEVKLQYTTSGLAVSRLPNGGLLSSWHPGGPCTRARASAEARDGTLVSRFACYPKANAVEQDGPLTKSSN